MTSLRSEFEEHVRGTSERPPADLPPLLVLIVDDHPGLRTALARVLASAGMRTEVAEGKALQNESSPRPQTQQAYRRDPA